MKEMLSVVYGRSADAYADTDSIRGGTPYTVDEVFNGRLTTVQAGDELHICAICGAAVALMWTHTQFHNNIADL